MLGVRVVREVELGARGVALRILELRDDVHALALPDAGGGVQRRLLRELALLRLIGNIQRRHRVVGRSSLPARPRSGDPGHRRRRRISPAPKISREALFRQFLLPALGFGSSRPPRFRRSRTFGSGFPDRRLPHRFHVTLPDILRKGLRVDEERARCRRPVHFRPRARTNALTDPLPRRPRRPSARPPPRVIPPTSSFSREKRKVRCYAIRLGLTPERRHRPRPSRAHTNIALRDELQDQQRFPRGLGLERHRPSPLPLG